MRRMLTFSRKAPWSGSYRSAMRLCDWLKLLGFEVEVIQYAFFNPPLNAREKGASDNWIEHFGKKYNCFFGSTYAIVARKQTAGMIPLREIRITRRVLAFPITEPTTRNLKASDEKDL